MKIKWSKEALDDYRAISASNSKRRAKINRLLKEILEKGEMNGTGKPERLRGDLQGYCSRKITKAERLVYRIKDESLEILSCKGHYND